MKTIIATITVIIGLVLSANMAEGQACSGVCTADFMVCPDGYVEGLGTCAFAEKCCVPIATTPPTAQTCTGSCVPEPCSFWGMTSGTGTCTVSTDNCCVASTTTATTTGAFMTSATASGLTPGKTLTAYAESLFGWIIGVVGFIAILGFLISAVLYFTAAGDEERAKSAKRAMTYSVIGVVIALSGFVILTIVNLFLTDARL